MSATRGMSARIAIMALLLLHVSCSLCESPQPPAFGLAPAPVPRTGAASCLPSLMCSGRQSAADRYLDESNKMRKVNPDLGKLVLTKSGVTHVSPGGPPGGTPAPAAGRTIEFVASPPEEHLATLDASDAPMCDVHLCDPQEEGWAQRLVSERVLSDRRQAQKLLRRLESAPAQALLRVAPWPVVRGAVGALGRLESALSLEMYPETVRGEDNPLLKAAVTRVMTEGECEAVVADAEAYAAERGWTNNRHLSHATVDIPITDLPKAGTLFNSTLKGRLVGAIASSFGFSPEDIVPVDVFVVKYSAEEGKEGQRELSVHRDGALMTFSLLLNDPADFEGGGTYFEEDGRVYRPKQGVAVLHSGKRRHGGYPITSGVRYIMVGFCLCRSPQLCDEMLAEERGGWRFGAPAWYVSSRATRDAEILNR